MLITARVTLQGPDPDHPGERRSHPPGSVLDLPDGEARALIARRFADPAAAPDAPAPEPLSAPPTATAPGTPVPPAAGAAAAPSPIHGDPSGRAADPAAPAAPPTALPTAPMPEPTADGAGRGKAIRDAIELLEPGNDEHWTKAGKPDTGALSDLCGFPVTAAERDAAWAAKQAETA